ncbi:hypothetical protein PENDEC_c021G03187 [Penicillium decumbens]|uniref:Uncharacterized protein n=1 Tax=Penicillium decumbens TaxID=69771 RepID=A0A1V6P6I3_PENDC|nr:hypothetical protein PENDEC_c021G03187 [Penicillium decumbens]
MSMEPWRKRGFVPDSDEEDESDSLPTRNSPVNDANDADDVVDLEYIPLPASISKPGPNEAVNEQADFNNDNGSITLSDIGDSAGVSDKDKHGLDTKSMVDEDKSSKPSTEAAPAAIEANDRPASPSMGEETPKSRREQQNPSKDNEDNIWDIPSSPIEKARNGRKSRSHESTPKYPAPIQLSPSRIALRPHTRETQNARELIDAISSRSSSPDELNVVTEPSPRSPKRTSDVNIQSGPQHEGSENDSPLSSPPSSLHSLGDAPEMEERVKTMPSQDDIDKALIDLGIMPGDFQQLSQPARRSLRERNAIQLHPYALELAKYQQQMRERGMKPIRPPAEASRPNAQEATDESQEQDSFNTDAPQSTPPPEEYLRPERHRERVSTGQGIRHRDQQGSPTQGTQSHKRRKRSYILASPKNGRRPSAARTGTQVMIDNNTPLNGSMDLSFFDTVSSPPDSPASRTPRASEVFRFPPGFTPPPTRSARDDSKPTTPEIDELPSGSRSALVIESDESGDSDASKSSAESVENDEDRINRLLQRRIRGVLPASWVRIDAEQRLKQQKAAQQRRHTAAQRADGKGVAKKIVRKPGQSRLQDLIDLGDSDESDEENRPPSTHTIVADAEHRPARAVGLDRDGDILEDNRIDYMLPTITRASSGPREERKGLKRAHSKEDPRQMERRLKKSRLKRQTRLTDSSYGARRTEKKRTASVPRLGILDAPDVVSIARKEQPQFLRIAARGARSRRDGGRQSPTRKFFQLGSKEDTADANESLRDWRRGAIKQTRIVRSQSKPRKSRTVAKLSTDGRRAAPAARNSRIPNHFPAAGIVQSPDDQDTPLLERSFTGDVSVPAAQPDRSAAMEHPTQAERRGHQWIVRRNVAISSLHRNGPRPAATSLAGPSQSQAANRAMFGRSLTLLNRDFGQKQASRALKSSLTLDRYISDSRPGISPIGASSPSTAAPTNAPSKAPNTQTRQGRGRLKKRLPTHLNVDGDEFAQDQGSIVVVSDDSDLFPATNPARRPSFFSVGGMFNWQRSYSVDFGVVPLRDGTFFHESTFIGSGELSRSLHISKRDLDREAGFSAIPARDQIFQCGAWDEKVSSELGSVFDMIVDDVEKSATAAPGTRTDLTSASLAYRSLIKYVTEHLTFIDPVDRSGFVSRATGLLFRLRDLMAAFITSSDYNKNGLVRFAYFNLVFANQIRQITSHSLVSPSLAVDALDLVKTSAKDTLTLVLGEAGIAELHRLFEETKNEERRGMGIREEFPSAEAYVVVQQLLHSSDAFTGILDDIQLMATTQGITHNHRDVAILEAAWRGLFAPLPLHEIDHHGIARRETRFKTAHDNWSLVKRLLSPALDNYDANSAAQPISYNAYCRTLFQRCHRLINMWGWRECRPALETLYDFFASKTLYNLKLEESRGSPAFLDELDQSPSLDVRASEPCFHTLLKIIASGLRFLSERYDNKKIRNFAWRLLPNHGRVYPKEKPLRHEDLDALRNHHDLLCTLYWAVPDGCRPRLETIRNLVHPASSHRETCSINIRSWSRLVRFKLSTKEDLSGLDPFADWHSYFVTELRQQHALARKEIEAQSKGDEFISQQLMESAISQNQRQIESLLSMALGGMQTAVELAPSMDHAYRLISKTPFDSVIGLFNPKLPRVNVVVIQALQTIVAYAQKDNIASPPAPAATAPAVAASADEDSQEFGFGDCDWADIDAVLVQQSSPPRESIEHVQRALHPVVSRLVSNCFGADHCPEDAILKSALECWTSIAHVLVRNGLKHWDNYLSQFGDESWTRLRDTLQTRKFAPQFAALCIEKDGRILSDCRIMVMGMWMSSLVERSSMLKFQHRLTEALLNGSPQDPLLQNLPFTKDKKTDRYAITLEELSHRRLSLISSVLSNMREHVLRLEASASRDLNVKKHDYSDLLQRMMAAMKDNYRELGNGAAESAQGAYVDFVHRIIRFLQELTSDIRPVDHFFTDPAHFPLPSTDPRYIVAKLKRYEPKLSSSKDLVTLTGFIQGISERALIEGQQSHLVDQLHIAMKDTYEAGQPDKPTLRAVLLQCVFPAYLELAFSSPAAWLLSRPVIQSIALEFEALLFKLDTTDPACVSSLLKIFEAVFQSSYRALRPLSNQPTRFKDPTVLAMVSAFIEMIFASLPVVDYIDRVTESADGLVSYIHWFRDFAVAVTLFLSSTTSTGFDEFSPPDPPSSTSATEMPQQLATARRLAFEDHQACLRSWSSHDGKYYYIRPGHDSKEIAIEADIAAVVENEAVAKKATVNAAVKLTDCVELLGLLPPCEGSSNGSHGGMMDESTFSSIYDCLRSQ